MDTDYALRTIEIDFKAVAVVIPYFLCGPQGGQITLCGHHTWGVATVVSGGPSKQVLYLGLRHANTNQRKVVYS
jgi:hypothetical protein